jgi:hypothetical protein
MNPKARERNRGGDDGDGMGESVSSQRDLQGQSDGLHVSGTERDNWTNRMLPMTTTKVR